MYVCSCVCVEPTVYHAFCRISVEIGLAFRHMVSDYENDENQVKCLSQILFQWFLLSLFPGFHFLHIPE